MSLLDEFTVECTMITRTIEEDATGGYRNAWTDGVSFSAAWEYESAPEVLVAEQEGVNRTYRIYVDKTLEMEYHDAFRRKDNGQIYRVTNPGTDRRTPSFSRLNKRLIEVEKWALPHEEEEEEEDVLSGGGA